ARAARRLQFCPHDRAVLLSSSRDGPVRPRLESVRLAVARHRARNRLRALLEGLAAPVLALWARRSRYWSTPAEAMAAVATPAATCLLMSMVVLAGGAPAGDGPAVAAVLPELTAPT